MNPGNEISLINLNGLSKPANTFIEKVSAAIGGICRPGQIRRVADAEADAKLILAMADLQVDSLKRRAAQRMLEEETIRQSNMESITAKALPEINDGSKPEGMDTDWIAHFFDRARLVSRDDMQMMWGKILAGEANRPGSFSRRTIDALSTLDQMDAEAFVKLCHFIWHAPNPVPIIWDAADDFYISRGINFSILSHLDAIGLIRFNHITGFINKGLPKQFDVSYFGQSVAIECPQAESNKIQLGKVLLTRTGNELCHIVSVVPIYDYVDFCINHWKKSGIKAEKRVK